MFFPSISSFCFLEPFPALFHQNIVSSATLVYLDRILVSSRGAAGSFADGPHDDEFLVSDD